MKKPAELLRPVHPALNRMLNESGIMFTFADRDYLHKSTPHLTQVVSRLYRIAPRGYPAPTCFKFIHHGMTCLILLRTQSRSHPRISRPRKIQNMSGRSSPIELDRLADEIINLDPNLIICLGNCTLFGLWLVGLVSPSSVALLFSLLTLPLILSFFPYLSSFRDSSAMGQPTDRNRRLDESQTRICLPRNLRPPREIWIEPSLDDIRTFIPTHLGMPITFRRY